MNYIINFCSVYGALFMRLAIGVAFLSSCADRFGFWGAPGDTGVAWGDFQSFLEYSAQLNPYLPPAMIPAISWFETIVESILGLTLIVGLKTRLSALLSGALLMTLALSMALALGIKGSLDYSVFSAAAGCFLLATQTSYLWSIDACCLPDTAKQQRI